MSVNPELYKRGQEVRKAILGAGHVERTAKNRTAFNAEFQDFLMQYAWGEVWSRPGLDHKQRSMLTIAMLVAMGKTDELKLHIRASRNTGVSRDEVKEILIHSVIYAGVPAAFSAFQVAAQTYDEMDREAQAGTT
jgi:4-carboxymuconolactone decarboxylase